MEWYKKALYTTAVIASLGLGGCAQKATSEETKSTPPVPQNTSIVEYTNLKQMGQTKYKLDINISDSDKLSTSTADMNGDGIPEVVTTILDYSSNEVITIIQENKIPQVGLENMVAPNR